MQPLVQDGRLDNPETINASLFVNYQYQKNEYEQGQQFFLNYKEHNIFGLKYRTLLSTHIPTPQTFADSYPVAQVMEPQLIYPELA